MRTRASKLRKIILRTLLLLVFISSIVAVLTRNRVVQTRLAQYFANELSLKLGTKVSIQGVEIDFLRNFHFEHLLVLDKQNDTILYTRTMDFQIPSIEIRKHVVNIHNLDFFKLKIKMGQYAGETKLNYEFIEDYFGQDTSTSTGAPWEIKIKNVSLFHSSYTFFYGNNANKNSRVGEFNPDYIRYNKINATIPSVNVLKDGTINFDVKHLQTIERSACNIHHLSTKGVLKNRKLAFNDMKLQTGESDINAYFSMDWSSRNFKLDYFHRVIFEFKVLNSKIRLYDFASFSPWFKDHSLSLNVTAKLVGPLAKLKSNNFMVTTSNGSVLEANYILAGIPNVSNIVNTMDFKRAEINQADVAQLFKVESWNEYLKPFGNALLFGKLTVPMGDLNFDGLITTDCGAFDGYSYINYSDLDNHLNYEFDGRLIGFEPNKISPSLNQFGQVNATVYAIGENFDEKANSEFDILFEKVVTKNKAVSNVALNGTLNKGELNAMLKSDDTAFALNAKIHASNVFTNSISTSIQTEIKKIDIYAMGLDTLPFDFSGIANINLKGKDLDKLTGDLQLSNFRVHRNKDEFSLKTQSIQRASTESLVFKGDWIDGSVLGPLEFTKSVDWVQHFLHGVAPDKFQDANSKFKDSVYVDVYIPQTAWIGAFFMPGLHLSPVAIQGNYFARKNVCNLRIGPFSVEYGLFYMEKTRISLIKPLSSSPLKVKITSPYILAQNTLYDTLGISGEIVNGMYNLSVAIFEKSKRYALNLNGKGQLKEELSNFKFDNTVLQLLGNKWVLDKNARIDFKNYGTEVHDFFMADKDHFIELDGIISERSADTLHLDFGNITPLVLTPFFAEHTFDSLTFAANGRISFNGLLGRTQYLGELGINRIRYFNFDYGNLSVTADGTPKKGVIQLSSIFRGGPLNKTKFNGIVQFKNNSDPEIDILGEIPQKTTINIIQPFLKDVVTFKSGTLGGNLRISGKSTEPKVVGLLSTSNVQLGVDYLGTSFSLAGNFKITETGLYTMRPIKFYDETKSNFGWMNLALTHDKFKDFAMDLKLDSLKNMKVLQTTESMNDLFYGTAYADGKCRIFGLFSEIDMDISLTTRKRTKLFIQYPTSTNNTLSGSVVFVKREIDIVKEPKEKKVVQNDALGKITLNIRATPDAEVQFVIDKKLGDIIKGFGEGDLKMIYDRDEKFYLYGKYTIQSGEYAFSLPGINLLKKISLNKGGYILWDGDALNGAVDISGSFEKKISPSTLMISTGNTGASYPTTKIVSTLNLKGNLFGPQITFDIEAPDLASTTGASSSEVNSVIQRIRADKDETMRQSVALLLFGNFLPPSFSGLSAPSSTSFSSTGFAGNSVSTIASSVVNDLFTKYGIPTRIQVNIDDVRNTTGNSNTQLFVNSEWFLSDRLRLDLNYDPTVAVLVNSVAVPINFNLEYRTSDENWRLKAFSRSNNLILQQNNTTTTNGVSGNTLGTGILYRREFDTFKRKKDKKPVIK